MTNKNEIILTKSYTRYLSLFWSSIWNRGETEGLKALAGKGFGNMLFLREPGQDKMTVWYSTKESEELYAHLEERLLKDKMFLDAIFSEFDIYYKKLLPYFENKKRIESVSELKDFYDTFTDWWAPMTVTHAMPELESLSSAIKEQTLNLRKEYEKYSDQDRIDDFISSYFPEYKNIMWEMLPEEFFLLGKRALTKKEVATIEHRRDGFGLLNNSFYNLDELEKEMKKTHITLKKETITDTSVVRGNPAYKGIVTGKVRVLLDKENIPLFQEGEVLVTEMTTPDFVPAMKKAVAVVTDEGGVTCHAAIVARELRVPTVIGTKIATQVLKDGDMVEVNASEGVVRVLESKKQHEVL